MQNLIQIYLQEIITELETARADSQKAAERHSENLHSQNAFQIGYLIGRINSAVESLKELQKRKKTYDVVFNSNDDSNNKGWEMPFDHCYDYIQSMNGTDVSYFGDYKGGDVSIVCNETGETVYSESVY